MENHLDLVRRGQTIKHHFGWQDFNDLNTKTNPIVLTNIGQWYEVTNDGAGSQSTTVHSIPDHQPIWDTETNSFNFSSLKVGDLVLLRLTAYITTPNSNVGISGKIVAALGSDIEYELPFFQGLIKTQGRHLMSVPYLMYIGNEQTRDNPAKIYSMSDNSGVEIEVDGWVAVSLCRN